MIIPGQFGFNCPSGFREEAFCLYSDINILSKYIPSLQKKL
jgi:hypothetical protein